MKLIASEAIGMEATISCSFNAVESEGTAAMAFASIALDACINSAVLVSPPKMKSVPETKTKVKIPQRKNCVSPTMPMPITFPIINWKGFTDETINSIMRFVFSSITPCITIEP